jgi:plastocyanin
LALAPDVFVPIGKNEDMLQILNLIRRMALPASALLLITACAGGASAGWTYAPLGPSANPSAAASAAPSAAGSPSGSGGTGTTISVETTSAAPIAFNPADLTVPAGASVTVNYTNNSNLPHNIHFFNGADQNAPSLGASTTGSGPNNAQTVTFTAPTQPGDYFFWCDVHTTTMVGHFHVQ